MWLRSVSVLLLSLSLHAAELKLTTSADEQGSTIQAILSLSAPGEAISSIQFDLEFDQTLLSVQSVEASPAATAQDKQAEISKPQPGVLRVLVTGMNRYPLLTSPVAFVRFKGTNVPATLRLIKAVAANPGGNEVNVKLVNAHDGAERGERRTRSR